MKYRMQFDDAVHCWRLVRQGLPDGSELVITHDSVLAAELSYAAVEFWAEIERLQAVNAELLAACRKANTELHDTSGRIQDSLVRASAILGNAIARAEQPKTNPENQT